VTQAEVQPATHFSFAGKQGPRRICAWNLPPAAHMLPRGPPPATPRSPALPSPDMILPVFSPGLDLVENARIATALERGGDFFLRRTYTDAEIAYCRQHRDPVPRFAARFAAKEAVAKAFGTGLGAAAAFKEIEVVHDALGAPGIRLHGAAAATAGAQGITGLLVSLTHTDHYAAAMVIAERRPA
jgi:holo-[acyl-carrier protein] synthase